MRLLEAFASRFEGVFYNHRVSTHGDYAAQFLFEDLLRCGDSEKYAERVASGSAVLNSPNRTQGVQHRRGDGSFGTIVPGEEPIRDEGFDVARGRLAMIQIGVEVKIMSKAMGRQVDRVIGDLRRQADQFKKSNRAVITVGIVGVNHAAKYLSREGDREYPSTGQGRHLHPIQQAAAMIDALKSEVGRKYDEFLILPFRATNYEPYEFEWVDATETKRDYGSALVRIAGEYQRRF